MTPAMPPIAIHAFKQGMRGLVGGVTILAAQGPGECVGMTATAVCSLSADPASLIACVNRDAGLAAILATGLGFSVNIPTARQEEVARAFGGMTVARGQARFGIGSWYRGETGAPILAEARAAFECRVDELLDRGTHRIVIATVVGVAIGDLASPGLAYSNGKFVSVL